MRQVQQQHPQQSTRTGSGTKSPIDTRSTNGTVTGGGTNYHGQRFPTLAPSIAARITAKQQQSTSPLTKNTMSRSPPPSLPSSSVSTAATKQPLTYQEKLQLNARYSLHGPYNQQATVLANQKIQQQQQQTPSLPVSAAPSTNQNLTQSSLVSSHDHGSNANTSILSGTAAVPLLRASSPVIFTTGGNKNNNNPSMITTMDEQLLPVNISNVSSVTQETTTTALSSITNTVKHNHQQYSASSSFVNQRTNNDDGEGYENYDLDSTLHSAITAEEDDEESERIFTTSLKSKNRNTPPSSLGKNVPPSPSTPRIASHPGKKNDLNVTDDNSVFGSPNFTVSPSPVKPLNLSVANIPNRMSSDSNNNNNTSLNQSFSSKVNTSQEFVSTVENATHVAQRLFEPNSSSNGTVSSSSSSNAKTNKPLQSIVVGTTGSPSPPSTVVLSSSSFSPKPKNTMVVPDTPNSMDDSSMVANFLKQLEDMDSQLGLSSSASTSVLSSFNPPLPQQHHQQQQHNVSLPLATGVPPPSSTDSNHPFFTTDTPTLPSDDTSTPDSNVPTVSTFSSIRTKVVAMTMELEEKSKTIAILRGQIQAARKLIQDKEHEYTERQQNALEQQQKEFESSITDKLDFIERLLADKSVLVGQLTELQQKYNDTNVTLNQQQEKYEQRLKFEIERTRETVLQQERVRREAWMESTTKQIKERTLKGLEPDIQKLLDKHKEEIEKIQNTCAEEIAVSHERFRKEKDLAVQQALEQAEGTETDKLKQERSTWKQRETNLREEYDQEIRKLRDKYREEIDDERRRSAAIARSDASRQLDELNKLQNEWQARIDDLLLRHAMEKAQHVTEITEAVTTEAKKYIESREAWEARTLTKLKREFEEKEREIRNDTSRTRDEQLKLVIARMDNENQEEKRKYRTEYDEKLQQQKNESNQIIDKLKEEWRLRCEEITASRDAILTNQGDLTIKLSATLDSTRQELATQKMEYEKINHQYTNLRKDYEKLQQTSIVNQHTMEEKYTKQIEHLQRIIEQLTKDKEETIQRFEHQILTLKNQQTTDIQELQARVNVAIRKRDDIIVELKAKVDEERAKAEVAKRLMQETRNELGGGAL